MVKTISEIEKMAKNRSFLPFKIFAGRPDRAYFFSEELIVDYGGFGAPTAPQTILKTDLRSVFKTLERIDRLQTYH